MEHVEFFLEKAKIWKKRIFFGGYIFPSLFLLNIFPSKFFNKIKDMRAWYVIDRTIWLINWCHTGGLHFKKSSYHQTVFHPLLHSYFFLKFSINSFLVNFNFLCFNFYNYLIRLILKEFDIGITTKLLCNYVLNVEPKLTCSEIIRVIAQ